MAARIYSLAKELKLDSKVLVDLCTKAGVSGKGSALASLTDEEVVKIKSYLSGPAKAAPKESLPPIVRPTAAPLPAQVPQILTPHVSAPHASASPTVGAQVATPHVSASLGAASPSVSSQAAASPSAASQSAGSQAAASQSAATQAAGSKSAASKSAAPFPAEPGPMRREDYLAPGGTSSRPPILVSKAERSGDTPKKSAASDASRPAARSGPAIRFAPLPTAVQPQMPAPPAEPEPQKPDIKLPVDAIRASKLGSKPLQAHLQKHEDKRKADAAKARTPATSRKPAGPAPGSMPAPDPSAPSRDRKRGTRAAPVAADAAAVDTTLGGREQRQLNRKRTGDGRRRGGEDDRGRRTRVRMKRTGTNTAAPRKGNVVVELPCTIRSFSAATGIPTQKIQGKLLTMGVKSVITSGLDPETVELLAVEFGVDIELKQPLDPEEQMLRDAGEQEDDQALLEPRPPVVTFLGHVDHGKTSLLDRIIGINVARGESGGITQHIRAYRIEKNGRPIAFVDTPGHEAFTEMRARGANVTDIAVLVVAADDGVMPQTEEAISHARAANVPIVVALNKVDLPGINFDRIYSQLVSSGLQPTEWGGETELVRCSAQTGQGMDDLLETLLTIAELQDYRANTHCRATGACLEAEVHEGRGVMAKLLVQKGTLRVGDVVVCGAAYGKVKAMYDTLQPRKTYQEALPSTPVNVTGLNVAPGAGDHFYVLEDISLARTIAEKRDSQSRQVALSGRPVHVTLENLHDRLDGEGVENLNLILRADVRGSIEAILKELTKLEHPEVQIKILQATVGGVTEADVHLADASDAIIIGFNVVPDEGARMLAEQRGVQIRRYDIIYQVTDDLRAALEGMLKPEQRNVELGRALVQRTFTISRVGTIAGCRVLVGTVERNSRVRVIRENRIIGDYSLESLRREKDDAREVREGYECGMKLGGYNDLKEGDVLEAYRVEEVARTL